MNVSKTVNTSYTAKLDRIIINPDNNDALVQWINQANGREERATIDLLDIVQRMTSNQKNIVLGFFKELFAVATEETASNIDDDLLNLNQ